VLPIEERPLAALRFFYTLQQMLQAIFFSRNLFPERVLFLSIVGGLFFDGLITQAFLPASETPLWPRLVLMVLAFFFLCITWVEQIPKQVSRYTTYLTIALFLLFVSYILIISYINADTAITFVGAFVICSFYFRSIQTLLAYLTFGLLLGLFAVYVTKDPQIDKWIFIIRLAFGSLLILGLSQATRHYHEQLEEKSQRMAARNQELAGIRAELESKLTQEQLLSLVANRSNVAVVISDKNDSIEWVNDAFLQIFGYTREECIGKTPDFFRGPLTDPKTTKRIQEKAAEKIAFYDELINYRKDKTHLWVSIHVTPLLSSSGETERYISIQEDISERRKIQDDLRQSQEQLSAAQRQAKIGSWEWDSISNTFQCSEELHLLLGLAMQSPVSEESFFQYIHTTDVTTIKKTMALSLRRRSPFEIDLRIIIGNQVQNMYMTGQGVDEFRLLGTIQDITERKKIEEEIKLTELRFRSLFEYSQNMICTHDMSGNLMSVNTSGAHILGYEPEELIGVNLHDIVAPDVAHEVANYLEHIQTHGNGEGILKIRKRNHKNTIWMYNNIKLNDVHGIPYILGSCVEITARFKMETELRQAKKMAEDALVMKDRFVANISHELRTPMNAILGFVEILLQSNINAEQRVQLLAVLTAGENLTAVINDILDLAKIESGKIDFENRPFQLRDTCKSVKLLLDQRAQGKGILFEWSCDPKIPQYILGDGLRLSQILINLVGNAVKFTQNGFVRFTFICEGENENSMILKCQVEDSGIGIESEKLQEIFEPFTQASKDATRKYGGTGLGLSIARDLIELQGGQISVQSTLGKGSTFEFILPVNKVGLDAVLEVENALQPVTFSNDLKILLAEDHPLNQQLAQKLILDFGFSLTIVNNGVEAIDVLEVQHFDVILMDLQMPTMDGYEATKLIRTELKLQTPIIALTAHSANGEKERCLALGMNDYLSKPFRAQELYFRIASVVPREKGLPQTERIEKPSTQNPLRTLAAGDWQFEKEMLQMLMRSVPEEYKFILEAHTENNATIIKQRAHRLKSSAALAGAKTAAEQLEYLEYHADKISNAERSELLEKFKPEYEKMLHEISAELSLLSEKL
jgi:PAS domain S-box-containing protein